MGLQQCADCVNSSLMSYHVSGVFNAFVWVRLFRVILQLTAFSVSVAASDVINKLYYTSGLYLTYPYRDQLFNLYTPYVWVSRGESDIFFVVVISCHLVGTACCSNNVGNYSMSTRHCCVCRLTPVETSWCENNLGASVLMFPHHTLFFLYVLHAYKMSARFHVYFNDVTAPRVQLVSRKCSTRDIVKAIQHAVKSIPGPIDSYSRRARLPKRILLYSHGQQWTGGLADQLLLAVISMWRLYLQPD